MGSNMMLWAFLILVVYSSCGSGGTNGADDEHSICSQIDSLELIRLGKPDYEDLGYYPREKLAMSLQTGVVNFTQNDTLVAESVISMQEAEAISSLLGNIKDLDKNRIYNPSMSWSVELELRVLCEGESGSYAVKSYGQNGQTPVEIGEAYRPLLRQMAKFSSGATR